MTPRKLRCRHYLLKIMILLCQDVAKQHLDVMIPDADCGSAGLHTLQAIMQNAAE